MPKTEPSKRQHRRFEGFSQSSMDGVRLAVFDHLFCPTGGKGTSDATAQGAARWAAVLASAAATQDCD
jgi:hypothetical protein